MKQPIVYLAGLINTDVPETLGWRVIAQAFLEQAGFEVRTPLKGKASLRSETSDGGITCTTRPPRTILLRDRADIREASVVLANLNTWGSKRPLVGTIAELAWAWDQQTPVIAVCPPGDYLMRNHPFLSEFMSAYHDTLDGALSYIIGYYGPNSL